MTFMGIAGVSTPVFAGGQGDPLFGDVNGDGIVDRVTLVDGGPGLCDVSVALGDGSGGFGPPTTYTYAKPGTPVGWWVQAIYQPSEIALADFNGDGRQDVYEWTDQGDGFRTFLNTSDGRLVPGPVQFCSGRPDFELADFDADGAMDVLIAYIEGCSGPFMGVVVVLDV